MGALGGAASGAAMGSAFGPWGTVVGAGIGLFGSLFGAHKQDKANKEALQFQRQQAQNAWANTEIDRRANYDQWAAQQRRLQSVFSQMGWGNYDVPTYAPSIDPRFAPMSGSVGTLLQQQRGPSQMAGSVGSYLR